MRAAGEFPALGAPEEALSALAARLREEGSVISPFVVEPATRPALGVLVAGGPRTARRPGDYALLVECVQEGYLLHYGEPRVLTDVDGDLALLAGDYLYARGLERLAGLGDVEAVNELSDLISLLAQVHVGDDPPANAVGVLWLAAAVAVAAGATEDHESAKAALREQRANAVELLAAEAVAGAELVSIRSELAVAAEAVGLKQTDLFDLG